MNIEKFEKLIPFVLRRDYDNVIDDLDYEIRSHAVTRKLYRDARAKADRLAAERADDRGCATGMMSLLHTSVGGRGTRRQGWDAAMGAVRLFLTQAVEMHHRDHGK